MGQWDDIMDLEDFIKKHGNKRIKKAWKEHMRLHNEYEAAHNRLCSLAGGFKSIAEFLKDIKEL